MHRNEFEVKRHAIYCLAIQSHHHFLLAGIFIYLQVHYDDRNAKEVTLIL
jgi:hypothetical protein